MRSTWVSIARLAGLLASSLAAPIPAVPEDMTSIDEVVEYDIESAYAKFELSATQPGLLTSPLVFELQVNAVDQTFFSDVTLNGIPLPFRWNTISPNDGPLLASAESSTRSLSVQDVLGSWHLVAVSFAGTVVVPINSSHSPEDITQKLNIQIVSVDDFDLTDKALLGFHAVTKPLSELRLTSLSTLNQPDFDALTGSFMIASLDDGKPYGPNGSDTDDDFDIEAEIESLLLLETKAGHLQMQIATKKQRIADRLREHRENVSLHHLLEQCDGIVCAAKVIAQRICDKVGLSTQPSFEFEKLDNSHSQHLIAFESLDEKPQQTSRNFTKSTGSGKIRLDTTDPAILPLNVAQDIRWNHPTNALFRVLEIIATALGLAALFAFIRRKCMSPRTRAERAADREERRNARAYRRAARRADMRRRWDAFLASVSCFKRQEEPRTEDYEEKRALILQDAFLEQELDQAEKGEVMEAEIRELRHAHEIVASLVRVDENRYDLVTPVHDPPPPLVPLPYDGAARSRASTGTLPSYTSESLPDYTSRPATELPSSNNSVTGAASVRSVSSTAAENSGSSNTANSDSGHSRRTRSTPTSSVAAMSPRVSAETLRTRQSKDSRRP